MPLPSLPVTDPERTSPGQWVSVAVLTLATFLVVTSEMLPVGVLTPMADSLGISSGSAGLTLTITGLVSAVTAPVVARVLGNLDRRIVLAVAMAVLAAGNLLTTLTSNFALLVLSRIIIGIGMGTVWGLASAVAMRLVAPRNISLAVSLAVSGVATASVLGVPLGTFIANASDWRVAFGVIAASSAIVAIALAIALPTLRRPQLSDTDEKHHERRSLLRPATITGLIIVVILVTAHFAAYTYVRPFLEEVPRMPVNAVALLLLLYGIFGLIGNFLAGALTAFRPALTLTLLSVGIAIAIALLAWFGGHALVAGIAIAVWGVAYGGLSVGAQLWMTAAAPDRIEHITGLYVGVFTAAIALGAFTGGIVVDTTGVITLMTASAALSAVAAGIALFGPGPKGSRSRQ